MTELRMDSTGMQAGLAFYEDPENYRPFDTYADGRVQIACIDPRDTDQRELTIDLQTPGGTVGIGSDRAVVAAADIGTAADVSRHIVRATADNDRLAVPGAHWDGCKYAAYIQTLHEQAGSVGADSEIWKQYLRYAEQLFDSKDIALAAGDMAIRGSQLQARALEGLRTDKLVAPVAERSEILRAVPNMTSGNKARIYAMNLTEDRGVDRRAALRSDDPLPVTAYHDNLGAYKRYLERSISGASQRYRMLGAGIFRSLTTRQAVAGGDGFVHLDIQSVEGKVYVDRLA